MPKTSFKLTPELDVADLDRSLAFYVDVIGFQVLFDRTEERFVFLDLDGVHLMLEEAAEPGRRFNRAAGISLRSWCEFPDRGCRCDGDI